MENPLASDLDHILEYTTGLWEEMRGHHIFITGGTGFFGCLLLESFAWVKALVLTRNLDEDGFGREYHQITRFHRRQYFLQRCGRVEEYGLGVYPVMIGERIEFILRVYTYIC